MTKTTEQTHMHLEDRKKRQTEKEVKIQTEMTLLTSLLPQANKPLENLQFALNNTVSYQNLEDLVVQTY